MSCCPERSESCWEHERRCCSNTTRYAPNHSDCLRLLAVLLLSSEPILVVHEASPAQTLATSRRWSSFARETPRTRPRNEQTPGVVLPSTAARSRTSVLLFSVSGQREGLEPCPLCAHLVAIAQLRSYKVSNNYNFFSITFAWQWVRWAFLCSYERPASALFEY